MKNRLKIERRKTKETGERQRQMERHMGNRDQRDERVVRDQRDVKR